MMVKGKFSEYENVKDTVKGWLMLYTIAFDCGFDFKKVNEGSGLVTPSDFAELLVKNMIIKTFFLYVTMRDSLLVI